jgi:hypothetical protein
MPAISRRMKGSISVRASSTGSGAANSKAESVAESVFATYQYRSVRPILFSRSTSTCEILRTGSGL